MLALGAFGQTIFILYQTDHISGDKLVLRQRDGAVRLGEAEIQAVMAFGKVVGIQPLSGTVEHMKNRLQERN